MFQLIRKKNNEMKYWNCLDNKRHYYYCYSNNTRWVCLKSVYQAQIHKRITGYELELLPEGYMPLPTSAVAVKLACESLSYGQKRVLNPHSDLDLWLPKIKSVHFQVQVNVCARFVEIPTWGSWDVEFTRLWKNVVFRVTLISDIQILISSFLISRQCLCQICGDSLQALLACCLHKVK